MPNKFKFKQYKLTDGKINSYNGFSYQKIETFDVPNTKVTISIRNGHD